MRREKWNFRPRSQKPECGPGGRASGWEAGEERREETEQPKQGLGHGRGVGSGCEIGVNWAIRGPCSRVTEPARRQCQPWSWERCACAGSSPTPSSSSRLLRAVSPPRRAETKGLAHTAGSTCMGSGIWWSPDRGREHRRSPQIGFPTVNYNCSKCSRTRGLRLITSPYPMAL